LIAYVHTHDSSVIKTIYHAINITLTEAKLFTIRCSINQATQISKIDWIIIIMDSIYAVKKIFDLSIYSYQIQVLIISKDLREFFKKDHLNSIEFWDCLSYNKWTLHDIVDKETKKFDLVPIFFYKFSWNFNRKNECDKIFNSWRIIFQAFNTK